jgi:hypothetical protein
MRRRRAEPPATRTPAAAPLPALRSLAIGQAPGAHPGPVAPPRFHPARVSRSRGRGAATAQRALGWGRRAGRRERRLGPAWQVWGTRRAWAPRRAPPARLPAALSPNRPATPGAAAASWRGWSAASPAASSAGWGRPPLANQEAYAKLEAGPKTGTFLVSCFGSCGIGFNPLILLFPQVRLLQFRCV